MSARSLVLTRSLRGAVRRHPFGEASRSEFACERRSRRRSQRDRDRDHAECGEGCTRRRSSWFPRRKSDIPSPMHPLLARLAAQLDEDDTPFTDLAPLQRDIAGALADEHTRIPTFCLIAEKILRRRIEGETEDDIAAWLVTRVGISADRTAQILGMAADAGHAAADIGDGADFDERVDRIAASTVAERPFVAAMVQMAVDLLHSETARLDRLDLVAGLVARLDIDEDTIAGVMRIVRDLLVRHAAGEEQLSVQLAVEAGMSPANAAAFVEQTLLARQAALRIREGEDVPTVFRELDLERAAPQFVIVALRLVDEPDFEFGPPSLQN
ncbi:MAG: hypothetical protein IAG13_08430 [Deltaproteobacteria bacterium]|nr:hypothetical protein [Nannocystaceae bacterium]